MIKLFLSTPCYGGKCMEQYAISLLQFQGACEKEKISLVLDTTENESLIPRARNISVARFLQKTDCDYFMFIDSDIHFEPEAIIRLIRSGHDVAVAPYPKKSINWEQASEVIMDTEGADTHPHTLMYASDLVMNFSDAKNRVEDDFIEVLDGPTGFMLIKRSVLEKMVERYGKDLEVYHDSPGSDIEKYYAVFSCLIEKETRRYLSEDYAFCRRWQAMGGKIHAHILTTLGHCGSLGFAGQLHLVPSITA